EAGTTKTDWRRPAPASHEESGQTQRSSAADAFAQPLPPVTEYTTAIPLELLRQHLDFPKDTEHTSFIPKDSEHTSFIPKDTEHTAFIPKDSEPTRFIPKDTEHTSFIPRDAERPSAMGRESAEPSGTPREVAENTELTNAAGLDLSLENDGVPDPIEREATK